MMTPSYPAGGKTDEVSDQQGIQSILQAHAQMDPVADPADAVRAVYYCRDMEIISVTVSLIHGEDPIRSTTNFSFFADVFYYPNIC